TSFGKQTAVEQRIWLAPAEGARLGVRRSFATSSLLLPENNSLVKEPRCDAGSQKSHAMIPMSNALSAAVTASSRAPAWNRWRDDYNPSRGLDLARCVTLLEQYQRGEMADPQWTYFFLEQSDPDLFAILERREAALLELDWEIKVAEEVSSEQW